MVEAAFPGVVHDGVVDRAELAARVVGRPDAMARLETIIHPLVRGVEEAFLATARGAGARIVVLDIPLLFETGAQGRCEAIVVVSCPPEVQRARVLARPGMSEAKFEGILARQVPDSEKRRRAHVVIETGLGLEAARRQVDDLLRSLAANGHGRLSHGAGGEG